MSGDANGENNETKIRLALLEQSSVQSKDDIEVCQRKIAKVDDSLEDVKDVQTESLIVLQKMETSLEHMNQKLENGEQDRKTLSVNQQTMAESFARTDAKFKVMVAILAAIGVSMLGVVVKLVFFSPILSGGGS
jgi:chromosome segregation ATPase